MQWCYNWSLQPNLTDKVVSSKIACDNVYIPIIVGVVVFLWLFIGFWSWRRKKRKNINNNLNHVMLGNDAANEPVYVLQPNVPVVNKVADEGKHVQYVEQPAYPEQQQYVAPIVNDAPPAYDQVQPNQGHSERAFTHQ